PRSRRLAANLGRSDRVLTKARRISSSRSWLASPYEDMQTPGDDGTVLALLMERVHPAAALGFVDRPGLDGDRSTALGQVAVEAVDIGLERKETARPDVDDAGTLKQRGQPACEPAVDRRRIRGRGDDSARESAIRMRDRGHIRVEVVDAEPATRTEHPHELGNGRLAVGYVAEHRHADDRVEDSVVKRQSSDVAFAELRPVGDTRLPRQITRHRQQRRARVEANGQAARADAPG